MSKTPRKVSYGEVTIEVTPEVTPPSDETLVGELIAGLLDEDETGPKFKSEPNPEFVFQSEPETKPEPKPELEPESEPKFFSEQTKAEIEYGRRLVQSPN